MTPEIIKLLHFDHTIIKTILHLDSLIPLEWDKSYQAPIISDSDAAKFSEEVKQEKKICYYCFASNEVAAFIIFSRSSLTTIKINSLWTHPSFRAQGFATALKLYVENWCRSQKIKAIQSSVDPKNDKMRKLNLKLGYVQGIENMEKKIS